MINKLIKLRGGIICRIIDVILLNGNSMYLVVNITNNSITIINPKDILYIMKLNDDGVYVSNLQEIVEVGI